MPSGEAKTRDGNVESMRVLAGGAGLGPQGQDPGAQPDARPDLDRTRAHPGRAAGPQRVPPPRAGVDLSARGRAGVALEEEISEIDAILKPLVHQTAPRLVAALGIGTDAASALLVTTGDNPERLRDEAAFAHLCGASPIEASSGKQERHRLNRSGDRQANSALWHIVITRMVYDPRTTEYIDRRTKEGLTKKEAVRCL